MTNPSLAFRHFRAHIDHGGDCASGLQDLYIELGLDHKTQDPFELAPKVGIHTIRVVDIQSSDAFVEPSGKGYAVTLSSASPALRRRFSLAHEIAHILLGHNSGHRSAIDLKDKRDMERQCDQIAAEILMPKAAVTQLLSKQNSGLRAIREISSTFKVSGKAAALRLVETTTSPLKIIFWDANNPSITSKSVHKSEVARGCFVKLGAKAPVNSTPLKVVENGGDQIAFENFSHNSIEPKYFVESARMSRSEVISIVHLNRLEKSNGLEPRR